MDFSILSNDELAQAIRDALTEAETRMADAGVADRIIKRFKHGHAIIADAGNDLVAGGHVTPDSVGGDKP